MQNDTNDQTPRYTIGAVARLTGLTSHSIRMWERRYKAVSVARSDTGRRLYASENIQRLLLLKRLVDQGRPISSVANLPDNQLKKEIEDYSTQLTPVSAISRTKPLNVAVLGSLMAKRVRDEKNIPRSLKITYCDSDKDKFFDHCRKKNVDVIVVESAAIQSETINVIDNLRKELRPKYVFICYSFATQAILRTVESEFVKTLRLPMTASALLQEIARLRTDRQGVEEQSSTPISRRYSDDALVQVASISTSIDCECPKHLVDLISNLNSFETYSRSCEDQTQEDAQLHQYLEVATSKARNTLEHALTAVLKHEGLEDKFLEMSNKLVS